MCDPWGKPLVCPLGVPGVLPGRVGEYPWYHGCKDTKCFLRRPSPELPATFLLIRRNLLVFFYNLTFKL